MNYFSPDYTTYMSVSRQCYDMYRLWCYTYKDRYIRMATTMLITDQEMPLLHVLKTLSKHELVNITDDIYFTQYFILSILKYSSVFFISKLLHYMWGLFDGATCVEIARRIGQRHHSDIINFWVDLLDYRQTRYNIIYIQNCLQSYVKCSYTKQEQYGYLSYDESLIIRLYNSIYENCCALYSDLDDSSVVEDYYSIQDNIMLSCSRMEGKLYDLLHDLSNNVYSQLVQWT